MIQIGRNAPLPSIREAFWNLGVAVSWQVNEAPAGCEVEIVKELRAPWRLARPGEVARPRDAIEHTGFSSIGPADKGYFWHFVLRRLLKTCGAGEKTCFEAWRLVAVVHRLQDYRRRGCPTAIMQFNFESRIHTTLSLSTKRLLFAFTLGLLGTPTMSFAADLQAGEEASAICLGCHAADGSTLLPEYPSLAGQNEKYLIKQMHLIRSGEREVLLMAGQLDTMSDDTIADIAAWYASLTPRQGQAEEINLEIGEKIYRAGIADKSVSACTACHGPSGKGNAPAGFPSLKGLSREYLVQQLTAYREELRLSDEDVGGMMRQTAHSLTDGEIEAVANYVSGVY